MSWFMDRIKSGFFEVINPYNRQTRMVPATPDEVHTIVFWSRRVVLEIEKRLARGNINLKLCCEKDVLDALPPETAVTQSACIPSELLVKLFGGNLSLRKDTGQRIKKGCGCNVSVDIGCYHQHPCYHNCLFCYANPTSR
jgi:hypothetical protein